MDDRRRFAAILFDLDGVLIRSEGSVERQWERWATHHGFDPAEIILIAHGRRILETLRIVAPDLASQEEADRIAMAEARDLEGVEAIPGAHALLSLLPEGTWAVVTSGSRIVAESRLRHTGLPRPAVLVTADDVSDGKPSPEPYRRAAQLLDVRPEACLVIEDAPPGITSGNAAGCTTIAIEGTFSRDRLGHATAVVDALSRIEVVPGAEPSSPLEVRIDGRLLSPHSASPPRQAR